MTHLSPLERAMAATKAAAARKPTWQDHYNDYCIDNFGGCAVEGRMHDEAAAYADQMMEEGA